jgi:hypothetical protein
MNTLGETGTPSLDTRKLEALVASYQQDQRLFLGALAGLLASIVGAGLWALITLKTEYQIGWMAVGVGFLVGLAIRTAGRGVTEIFGYLGAGLALFGCLLGNLLTICGVLTQQSELPFLAVFAGMCSEPGVTLSILKDTFHPMDALFYGIAVYEGYRFSFRQMTEEEVGSLAQETT